MKRRTLGGRGGFETKAPAEGMKALIELLRARAIRFAGTDADAWDLVQDTFVRALKKWRSPWTDLDTQRWMSTVLRNLHLDRVRSAGARVAFLSDTDAVENLPSPLTPDPPLWKLVDSESLNACVSRLPAIHREVLMLRMNGKSAREIAKQVGIAPGTVATRAFRARKQLQAALREELRAATVTSSVAPRNGGLGPAPRLAGKAATNQGEDGDFPLEFQLPPASRRKAGTSIGRA